MFYVDIVVLQCLAGLSKRTRRIVKPNPISRPIVPRTLLPKAPMPNDQVMRFSIVGDEHGPRAVSAASTALPNLSDSFLLTSTGENTPTKPKVITMAPTEFRKRRIVPTPVPVAIPCGMLKLCTAVDATCFLAALCGMCGLEGTLRHCCSYLLLGIMVS